MREWILLLSAVCLMGASCASGPKGLHDVTELVDISDVDTSIAVTTENAEDILRKYIADFTVPNPLFGESYRRNLQNDPSHQSTVYCRAVLLDDYSTRAYVAYQDIADSLEGDAKSTSYDLESEPGPREGMFRIRLAMESGFSDKSMEQDHWAIYLENTRGTMIEPVEIVPTPVVSDDDSIFSAYRQIHVPRRLLRRNLFLYFRNITFFGEDLFGADNPFIVLVMSREKRTVARVAWRTGEIE